MGDLKRDRHNQNRHSLSYWYPGRYFACSGVVRKQKLFYTLKLLRKQGENGVSKVAKVYPVLT